MSEQSMMASPMRSVSGGIRRSVWSLGAVAAAAQAWLVAHDLLGVGGHAMNGWTTNWVQNNVFLLASVLCLLRVVSVRTDRLACGRWRRDCSPGSRP